MVGDVFKVVGANPKAPTPKNDIELARRVVRLLNSMYEADPNAVACLIDLRVPVNQALANHELTQSIMSPNGFAVGLLGVLNGLCGVNQQGSGYIAAIVDDFTNDVLGFTVVEDPVPLTAPAPVIEKSKPKRKRKPKS